MVLNEHQEQKVLVRWFRLAYPSLVLFAIPNGGARAKITAARLKDEGVLAGVSDLFLMAARGGYYGLFIEMKAVNGKLSTTQKQFVAEAHKAGYRAVVCYGFKEAQENINNYLRDVEF